MPHLFYFIIPETSPREGEIVLQGEEAHHAIRVVRIKVGEPIAFIDGNGGKWFGEVSCVSKNTLTARIVKYQYTPKEEKSLTLILGWLHRDTSIEMIINYGTELGISEFRFFQAERSTRPLRLSEKVKRWAIQSCKTTGREWFPEINIYNNLECALLNFRGKLFVATIDLDAVPIQQLSDVSKCGLIIGPEGDLSEQEQSIALKYGAVPVHLGSCIYRSELSAILGSVLIMGKQQRFEKPPEKDFLFDR